MNQINATVFMFRKRIVVFVFFLVWAGHCPAQPVIIVNKEKERINIGQLVALLKDTSGQLSFREVSSTAFDGRFKLSKQKTPNLGSTLLPVWCRFAIKNLTTQELVLAIDNSQIESLDLYLANLNNPSPKSISAYRPFKTRDLLLNKCFFTLDIPKDSTRVYYLHLKTVTGLQFPLTLSTFPSLVETERPKTIIDGIFIGIMIIMILYNFFIFLSIRDRTYLLYVLYVLFMTLTNVIEKGIAFEYLWPSYPVLNHYINIAACITGIFAILFSMSFLHISRYTKKLRALLYGLIFCFFATIAVILLNQRYIGLLMTEAFSMLTTITLLAAGIIIYRKGYKPALFYLVAWTLLLIGVNILILKDFDIVPYTNFTVNGMAIGSAIEAMLLSLALANRINVYKKEKEVAQSELLVSMEKTRKLITDQNILLEKKVEERTLELQQTNKELTETFQNLKAAQSQLIQSEKMASLGELSAGIAHEIQNPLNFVNNFAEVNTELIDELKEEQKKEPRDPQNENKLMNDLEENLKKIVHHGKRADSIVKGMLYHSRTSDGKKEPTNLNVIVDEYFRLSYHGLRAKDKTFNATLQTHFDETIGKIDIVPHDIGRVVLNLFTNAFYAVKEKATKQPGSYVPTVSVTTKKAGNKVEIRVKDNGMGIPQKVLDKIFQPFFTTKPSGQGTGLGLSLSYDIIEAHAGELKVETKEGEGTEFIIILPI